jgi:hypothetical protein
MKSINGKVLWSNDYEFKHSITYETRKEKYDRITNYLDYQGYNLKISQRIGSASKSAEVYLGNLSNIKENLALKVLPIINKNSYEKNENEIRAAVAASTLALERSSIYFPIVYSLNNQDCLCNDIIFYNDEFNSKSREYQKNDIYGSHILLSELAKEDLYTYLHKNKDDVDWEDLLKHCFKAIDDLHYKLNIVHNDLHLKNFLVISGIPLIHDFGNAEFVNEDEIRLYGYDKLDKNFFIENLLELDFLPLEIRNQLKNLEF